MKKITPFLGMLLLVLSIGLLGCTVGSSDAYAADAYVVLDINPSIEIITGEDGLVAQVNALNDDAEALLIDTDFVGKTVLETTEAIIALATEMGYIDYAADNAIIVTAVGTDDQATEELENHISERIREYSEKQAIRMNLIQARAEATAEMTASAETLGVSIGKLKLITLAMEFDETLTLEAGSVMSVRDLNAIIQKSRGEMKEFISEELKGEYFAFRGDASKTFVITRLQSVYDAMLAADDAAFADLLADSTATPADVKAMYLEYLNAVGAIVEPTAEEVETVESEIEAETEADPVLEALLASRETLKDEMEPLKTQFEAAVVDSEEYEALKLQLQAKWRELHDVLEEIKDYREEFESAKEETVKGPRGGKRGYKFEINDEEVTAKFDWMEEFRAVKETYIAKFAEINVDLEDLEQLFVDETALDALREQYENDLEALKAQIQSKRDAIREQYRESKESTRAMWGK